MQNVGTDNIYMYKIVHATYALATTSVINSGIYVKVQWCVVVKNKNKACVPTPLVSLYVVIIILPLPKIRAKRLLQVVYNWHRTIKVMFHKILFMQMTCLCHLCAEIMADHETMLFFGPPKSSVCCSNEPCSKQCCPNDHFVQKSKVCGKSYII